MDTVTQTNSSYAEAYERSIQDPEGFWGEQAQQIAWFEEPKQILSTDENGFYRWFAGGKLNTSYLALDYHVENGRADQTALIYDSPVTNTIRKYSYREFRDMVARFAGALRGLGVEKGDTVVIYMPVIPEAVVAMLACARLGAIHSVVFGGFAPHELTVRIDDARPKVVVSASCGIEFDKHIPYKPLLDKALNDSKHKPEHTIILQRPYVEADMEPGRDLDYMDALQKAQPADPVPVDAHDPLYVLYTSGTTGKPKGIIRDNGGHAVALKFSMKAVYGVEPGDVFWAASDVGWAVGHSYLVYAPLIHGCTTVLFEGKPVRTPDAGTFWRVIMQHDVKVLFTAPTAIRAIKKEDPSGIEKIKYDLPSLKYLFLAGERCDPATYYWAKDLLRIPVIDHWWQTESGWPMVANMVGYGLKPARAGAAGLPVCGYKVEILGEEGQELIPAQEGYVAVKLPLPPGCLPTLWEDNDRFFKSYLERFPGYYMTGDGGYMDEDGYIYIMGRIDDVINVSGHRLSTGEMEEMVASHPAVAECAVVGIADDLRGQRPVGLVVLKDGQNISEQQLEQELIALIREKIGAVAYFRNALIVNRLPKTRSGKILRKILRNIADGVHYAIPSTIDDPAILTEIHDDLKERKIGNAFLE
ncbi:propionyl-CoA synthetase [Pontibacter sp. HSC-14F20]|uniref:propionyl-CoA synthetase n=1 Tax=Pontibacter sp. HSC-14F20 TaxID=2864136 RepID=UPI001C72B09C|nr:propionyl-CoA synthetase [Pontibacter sp. HSC-14F20]MBX0334613.1 propionyl-CoA synthetase [Pontibacter sp. HSC-14F20]